MKKSYLLITAYLLSVSLYGQDELIPPTLMIEGPQPKWLFISQDSAFVSNGTLQDDTKYSLLTPNNIIETSEQTLMIIDGSRTQSPGGGASGQNYYSLDKETGEPQWIKHINHWHGNTHRESVFFQSNQLKGDIAQSLTFRDVDSIDLTFPSFGFYGAPVLREINTRTGETVTEIISRDTIRENHTSVGNGAERIYNCGEGGFLSIIMRTETIEDTLRDLLYFYSLDENLSRSAEPIYVFDNNTEISTRVQSLSYGILPLQYNDTTIVVAHHKVNPAELTLSEKRSYMTFLSVANPADIKEIYSFSTQMPHPHSVQDLIERVDWEVDGDLLSTDILLNITGKFSHVVDWWSPEGENKFSSDNLQPEDVGLRTIRPLKVINDELYLVGSSDTREPTQKVYILKIKAYTGEVEIVKTIEFSDGEENRSLVWRAAMMEDGDVVLSMLTVDNTDPDVRLRYAYHYCFDGADLGIVSSTEDYENKRGAALTISPNPVDNILQVKSEAELIGKLIVMDATGQTYRTVMSLGGKHHQINVFDLPSGHYFLQFRDKAKVNSTVAQFVKL